MKSSMGERGEEYGEVGWGEGERFFFAEFFVGDRGAKTQKHLAKTHSKGKSSDKTCAWDDKYQGVVEKKKGRALERWKKGPKLAPKKGEPRWEEGLPEGRPGLKTWGVQRLCLWWSATFLVERSCAKGREGERGYGTLVHAEFPEGKDQIEEIRTEQAGCGWGKLGGIGRWHAAV